MMGTISAVSLSSMDGSSSGQTALLWFECVSCLLIIPATLISRVGLSICLFGDRIGQISWGISELNWLLNALTLYCW